jgi:hypothetical protein
MSVGKSLDVMGFPALIVGGRLLSVLEGVFVVGPDCSD